MAALAVRSVQLSADNQPDDDGNPSEGNFPPPEINDPDDDPEPDHEPNPAEAAPQLPDQALARSLELLANNIALFPQAQKPKPTTKYRVPDVFDGTDPSKHDTFVFQCAMYLAACPHNFPDEESKVAFVLSYLKGVPLDWFQGEMSQAITTTGILPAWFTTYATFLTELKRLFGPRDPVMDATNALEGLKYKDSTKAVRYTIEFNRHAHRTGWNDTALARQYYKGLPDRLKDEIARIGKPAGLRPLQDLVATLDQRYWERQSEISRDKRSTATPNSPSQTKSTSTDNHNDSRTGNTNASSSKSTPNNPNQSKNKDQRKPAPAANNSGSGNKTNNISDLLGPDGKLKPEERQRRMTNNLCLRCGKPGHTVNNCTVTSKAKSKGRAATVASTSSSAAPVAAGSGKE